MRLQFISSIQQLTEADRSRLPVPDYPFLRLTFLDALETSGCCSATTGWQPCHAVWRNRDGQILAFMPLYLKSHSWGEYVFDGGWAHAYDAHGLDYYPKLITAIPFTPVPGPRMLLAQGVQRADFITLWTQALPDTLARFGASSWHLLFSDHPFANAGGNQTYLTRHDCQFHWHNTGYPDFDAVLLDFRSRKRKSLLKERQRLAASGIRIKRITGQQITQEVMNHFYGFYQNTYHRRGHRPHLNPAFFDTLRTEMPDTLCLVLAELEGQAIAGAFFFFDQSQLYGRYWGAKMDVNALHFECCYYQGMEFCIERDLSAFNPGTQGEHKISRGFEPQITQSQHWIAHGGFNDAIGRFLTEERQAVQAYREAAVKLLPFNRNKLTQEQP